VRFEGDDLILTEKEEVCFLKAIRKCNFMIIYITMKIIKP
jgi:hypothetical protein